MMCNLLLSWALVLTACGPAFSHPISESAEMSYTGPVSAEEGRLVSPEDLSLSDQAYLSQSGINLGYPSLLAGEMLSRDGLRPGGYLPREAVKEVLLEKQSRLRPFGRFLGQRRQYRKRGSGAECFWKYCV
ncbi:prepro-urotensin II-beta-like [Conger conger]|uniref:prepro-urotensin II-beta-like n=1 Tax=Conger conger TaxID=82655 RepID=UPI002A598FAD|nr:prepro-urotensin II-beta-like [Conger conger]